MAEATEPTWRRNPQDLKDAFDWETWFAPARDYRDMVWSGTEEAWVPSVPRY